jgi:hypothetical protein
MDVEESVRLLLKKQHPVKRQPHSATILKRWRGEESPSVYGGEDVKSISLIFLSKAILFPSRLKLKKLDRE